MAKETAGQKATIDRVMHEFKDGTLESSSGAKVKSRRQAVAIGLSEAGASNRVSPAENRRNRTHTRKEETAAERTKADLYAEAKRCDVAGRSRMTKAELARALA